MAALPSELTEHESVIDRRELFRAVTASLVGTGLPVERGEAEVEKLLADGAVVEIGHDAIGLPRYSTPEIIEIERDIVHLAGQLVTRTWQPVDQSTILEGRTRLALNPEQKEAALAATGRLTIVIVEGAPGSGKTTMLAPVVDAYRPAGLRVVGAATAWRRDQMRNFIYGVGVGITLSFTVVFALSSNLGMSIERADSTIIVGQ